MVSTAAYTTAAALRAQINVTSNAHDVTVLTPLIAAASRAIDNACGRPDGFDAPALATTRSYASTRAQHLWIDECVEVTAVSVKDSPTETTWTAWTAGQWIACSGSSRHPDFNNTPYTLLLINPSGDHHYWPSGRSGAGWPWSSHPDDRSSGGGAVAVPSVQVTARWGYADTPPDPIVQATTILAARWYKRGQSSWGDVLANADVGTIQITPQTDPDVYFLLRQGRLIRVATGTR